MKSVLMIVLLLAGAGSSAGAWEATYLPTLEVSRAPGRIDVDGVLDDEGWRGAALAKDFAEHQPGDQTQPPYATEVLITYDQDNLYVGFTCYDDPNQVRASFSRRDASFGDDLVFVCIDPFGDGAIGYEIAVNPHGIQTDIFFSQNGGEDSTFDMIYTTAARITDQGWVAEFAIPFSSLRFPDREQQVWKMDFWRNFERGVRTQASWAAYDRDESCWPCQWGTVTGIRGVKPSAGIEVIPAFVADQAGRRTASDEFDNGKIKGEPSLTARYAVSSDLVVDATVNPDFSQVESDAAQIDVNSNFALFYPEKRPFFQERADLFGTWFNAIYTRSINDPSVAGKVTGRHGKTAFAVLSAFDEHSPVVIPFEETCDYISNGESFNNIVRIKQEIGEQTHLGAIGTHRRYESGGLGALAGLDSGVRLSGNYRLEAQYLRSFTTEPDSPALTAQMRDDVRDLRFDDDRYTAALDGETYDGHALYASFEREARHLSFDFDYWDRSPTFRAENGFEVQNNNRHGAVNLNYMFRFAEGGLFEWVAPSVQTWRSWNYDGYVKDEAAQLSLEGKLSVAQTGFHGMYKADAESFDGIEYRGLNLWHMCFNSRPDEKVAWGGSFNYGHRVYYRGQVIGGQTSYSLWCDLKPVDRLLLETSCAWSRSRELDGDATYFKGHIFRSKIGMQLTRELSCRLVLQYHGFNRTWEADPLLEYQLNPFSIFYVGSTRDYALMAAYGGAGEEWRLANRQYFLKLQYLFRI